MYKGKCSKDFGLYISGSGTFNAPERDVELVEIPGKNGALVLDNGRFKNIAVTYPAFIRHKFRELSHVAREWLLSGSGYARLQDSYNPDYFRMARFGGALDFETRVLNRSGECSLTFDCKPQRFLAAGEYVIPTTEKMALFNPTPFPALPLIRVYGTSGTLMVGENQIQIEKIEGYIDIDSESQNAFCGSVNCNADIYAPEFPVFNAGKTGISFEGNIEKIEIKPRWWTI